MSTINKIFKTVGVAALYDSVLGHCLQYDFERANVKLGDSGKFVKTFGWSAIFTTLPALLGVGIDKFVNQKFTSHKTIQYALTALESFVTTPTVLFLYDHKNKFLKYYKNIFSVLSADVLCKSFALSTMCQSLAFKYIWDSSDETHELNTEFDQQPDLIELV